MKPKFIAVLASCFLALHALAATNNPNTDWFLKAGYGVFVHYLEDLQNDPQQIHSLGRRTSWDECVREFDVNGGVHFAKLGVDGNPKTTALAGGEWPWSYEVDLLEPHALRRVKVTFAQNGYATQLRISVSSDRKGWETVASAENLDGRPFSCDFAPVQAQYVRVSALKPNGPNQTGAQMAVAELEVYE